MRTFVHLISIYATTKEIEGLNKVLIDTIDNMAKDILIKVLSNTLIRGYWMILKIYIEELN